MTPNIPTVVKECRCSVVQETQETQVTDDDGDNNPYMPSSLHAETAGSFHTAYCLI